MNIFGENHWDVLIGLLNMNWVTGIILSDIR